MHCKFALPLKSGQSHAPLTRRCRCPRLISSSLSSSPCPFPGRVILFASQINPYSRLYQQPWPPVLLRLFQHLPRFSVNKTDTGTIFLVCTNASSELLDSHRTRSQVIFFSGFVKHSPSELRIFAHNPLSFLALLSLPPSRQYALHQAFAYRPISRIHLEDTQ